MSRFNRFSIALLALAGLAGAMTLASFGPSGADAPGQARFSSSAPGARWGRDYLPNLPVVDQDGKEYRFFDDLIAGKNVVINFIFTTCNDICPLTTARMSMIQERLGDVVGRDVHMYSITIDPEHDGPKELKQYAEAFKIGPGWRLLTGKPADIAAIRDKLGERSRIKSEHRHEMLLGNAASGNWSKDSAFGDLERVIMNIRSLDPNWCYEPPLQAAHASASGDAMVVEDKPGQALFIKACASCHTVGRGDKVGPDLAGLMARRDRAWVQAYLMSPDALRAAKDPVAMTLREKFPAVRMPTLGLSETDVADLVSYLGSRELAHSVQIKDGKKPPGEVH